MAKGGNLIKNTSSKKSTFHKDFLHHNKKTKAGLLPRFYTLLAFPKVLL